MPFLNLFQCTMKYSCWAVALMIMVASNHVLAGGDSSMRAQDDSVRVMETFKLQNQNAKKEISDHKKHLIMFIIAVPLLLLLLATGILGIAMVVYGKPVFLMHMICAGLSITLAIVHAIVGLVWFNPF